jgi:hypothetical protein
MHVIPNTNTAGSVKNLNVVECGEESHVSMPLVDPGI